MKDRVVQYPHRYQLVPVPGESDTYDIIAKPGTITEVGTPLNKATLLSDATAALYGLTGDDATVDGALRVGIYTKLDKLLINSLLTSLQLSLSSTNIDAWCDQFVDDSMINTELSGDFSLWSGNYITAVKTNLTTNSAKYSMNLKYNSSRQKVGFYVTPNATSNLYKLTIEIRKDGTGAGDVSCALYRSNGTTLIASALNTIPASSISTQKSSVHFYFDDVSLTQGTTYMLVFEASGGVSSTNYYTISTSATSGDKTAYYDGSSWVRHNHTGYYTMALSTNPEIFWKPVNVSSPLSRVAVVIDATQNLGEVTSWVSPDGVTWTEVEYNTMIPVSIPEKLYIKTKLTRDAQLRAIAWGGL